LDERDEDYQSALARLQEKSSLSGFSPNMVQNMIRLVSTWKIKLHPPRVKNNGNKMVWATSPPSLLQRSQKDKNLKSESMIAHKLPASIGSHITN